MGKDNFLSVIAEPWKQTFTPNNIKATFRKTGVWPVDRSVITHDQIAPSIGNSVKGGFPLQQPKMLAAMDKLMLPPSSPSAPSPPVAAMSPASQLASPPRIPDSRTCRQARAAISLLQGTSGRFLVTSDDLGPDDTLHSPVLDNSPLSSPEWSLARQSPDLKATKAFALQQNQGLHHALLRAKKIRDSLRRKLDARNAALVLHGLHLRCLERALHRKKKKRNDLNMRIFKAGHGVLLTSDENIEITRAASDAKTRKKTDVADRKTARATRKSDKDAKKKHNEALWASWRKEKAVHDAACAEIRAANPRQKRGLQFPPKPVFPFAWGAKRKGRATEEQSEDEESGAESPREDSEEESNVSRESDGDQLTFNDAYTSEGG